ncbi:small GTP-binding protein, putative [Trichomonas vaginalis G3]|uniref:Small GTP-binding protein, putative n=1 Tax=Trichomonas vaginalis (strain ATCC PRA-98 / G3) TaxID=412133 RepID=A2EF89_TRIV3|nr:GTPase protein [Trichomonas vaginalis G3]EAY08699.1 small GTP-binding protein, putative [Trichomonas vaginalis G3]KAI5492826.1 GTPase protein [Trichomonas vaginalis G3]|eukprot:XP_001320922.1 small GTP-binding protein [Trichomonas vaginalis G3]
MSTLKGKVVLVGDTSVGKTAIVNCFNRLSIDVSPTIGANSITCNVKLDSGETVQLNIWDTAGQDDFQCLVPMYARCAQVALVVYDQTQPSSFASTEKWIDHMKNSVGVPNVFLVGNKMDLNEVVETEKAIEFAESHQVKFFRTSALNGNGVDDLFQEIAIVVNTPEKQSEEVQPVFKTDVHLEETKDKKKTGCC